MSTNVTPISAARKDDGTERIDEIHGQLTDEICSLRCVYHVVNATEDAGEYDEEISSARNLLGRTIQSLEKLSNRLDQWCVDHRQRS